MRKLSFATLALLIAVPVITAAQSSLDKDSLLRVIASAPEDSNKAITYLHYGGLFELENPDTAQFYYTKSWELAKRLDFKRGMGMNISYQIFLLNNQGKFREALHLCRQAVDIYKEIGTERDLSIALNNVGNEHQYLGELRPALDHYLQAVSITEKLKDSTLTRVFLNNVASVFVTLKEFDKGARYATLSHQIALNLRDTLGMATSLVNLATAEAAQGFYSKAMLHLQQVINYSEVVNDYTLALDGLTNIGTIYNSLKKYDLASLQFQNALKLARSHENPAYQLVSLIGLADTYLGQRRYTDADKIIAEAITIASSTDSKNELNELYLKAAQAKEGLGNLAGALDFRKKYQILHDTLLNQQVRNNISELEVQYQTAKKDQSLAEQNLMLEQNKVAIQQKNLLLAWATGGAVLLLVIFLASYRLSRQKQKLNAQKILALQKEQEVIRLKAILEGQDAERQRISREMHDDVGSGLTSILYMSQSLAAGNAAENATIAPKISKTANVLVEKMNEIIWSLNKQFNTIEDLIVYTRHSVSGLLEDRDINYSFEVPDEIPDIPISAEQRRNIYLVVKEAVHNAIKHSCASLITITFKIGNEFEATVHDNGKGIDLSSVRYFGNGLNNMRQRMESIGGQLDIVAENGTSVRATLPLSL